MQQTHNADYIADRNWRRISLGIEKFNESEEAKLNAPRPALPAPVTPAPALITPKPKLTEEQLDEIWFADYLKSYTPPKASQDDKQTFTYQLAHQIAWSLACEIAQDLGCKATLENASELAENLYMHMNECKQSYFELNGDHYLHLAEMSKADIRSYAKVVLYEQLENAENAQTEAEVKDLMEEYIINLRTLTKAGYSHRRRVRASLELFTYTVGGKYNNAKCSTYRLAEKKQEIADQAEWLKNSVITNTVDKSITFPLIDASHNNKKKLAEIYSIFNGMEGLALEQEMVWASVTVTAEPKLHPNPANGQNSWNGTLPLKTNKILQKKWKQTRSVLAKCDITLSGLRTVEAHKDACPHVNYIIFFKPEDRNYIKDVFEDKFGHYIGTKLHGLEWQDGKMQNGLSSDECKDQGVATAASYALKYYTKFLGDKPDDSTICEAAWASNWGIRRCSFFGLPSLQQRRFLRISAIEPNCAHGIIADAWLLARNNMSKDYIKINGGLGAKAGDRPLSTLAVPHHKWLTHKKYSKTKIYVGVTENSTGFEFRVKSPGQWKIETAPLKTNNNSKTSVNNKVTLVLKSSRERALPPLTPPNLLTKSQLLPVPPLIH